MSLGLLLTSLLVGAPPAGSEVAQEPPPPAAQAPEPVEVVPASGEIRSPDTERAGPEVGRTIVTQVGEAPRDGLERQRRADRRSPGLVHVIELEHEAGARPADGLAELLDRAPASTVRSLGGLGQFASVSIRGSSGQQVQLLYEGVPLQDVSSGLTSLGDLPLDGLEAVEIHRGFVPPSMGGAAMGGAVQLVGGGVADRLRASGQLGFGSFAGRDARASVAVPLRRGLSVGARFGYAGSEGGFRFYDNGGTPQLLEDDRIARRTNNGYDRLAGALRFDGASARWRWSAQQFAFFKVQGVPGPATAQSAAASLESLRTRTMARVSRRSFWAPGGRLDWVGGLTLERRDFGDPRGELGVGVDDQRTETLDLYLAPSMRLPAWSGGFVGIQADLRAVGVRVDERAADATMGRSGDATRARTQVGISLSLEQFLAQRRVQLVPVLRFDALDSRFAVGEGQGEFDEGGADVTEFALSPRFGLRATLVEGLSLRLSGGRYFRPPTLVELFGDRGFARGSETLRSERGHTFDLGLVVDRSFGGAGTRGGRSPTEGWGLYAQLSGFANFSRDLITWVQAGPIVRPVNLEGARAFGAEASVQVATPHRYVIVQSDYTFTDTLNLSRASSQNGQPLPGRPRHEWGGRLSGGAAIRGGAGHRWEPRVFVRGDYIAQNFLDPSGRVELPPRTLLGLGAELQVDARVFLAAELRNLLDRKVVAWTPPVGTPTPVPLPMADFIGYPLPSRSLWVSASLRY